MVEGYPHSVGGWGVTAVFKEAGRLLVQYFGLLATFILAFALPLTLIQLLEIVGVAWWTAGLSPFLPPGPHRPHTLFAPTPLPPAPSDRDLFILIALGFVSWLLVSLATASFCKAVEYIYSENEADPSAVSSIFLSLPWAVFRQLVTTVCVILLVLVASVSLSLPFAILEALLGHVTILLILQAILLPLAVIIVGFLVMLAQEVAVLEPEKYGLAALKRSAKLVEEKLVTALVVFLFSIAVSSLIQWGSNWVGFQLVTGNTKIPAWALYVLAVVIALLYLLFLVYVLLVSVVLYFTSKVKYDGRQSVLPVDNQYSSVPSKSEQRRTPCSAIQRVGERLPSFCESPMCIAFWMCREVPLDVWRLCQKIANWKIGGFVKLCACFLLDLILKLLFILHHDH